METLNAGTSIKIRTHVNRSDMADAKAQKITLLAKNHVNTTAKIQPSKKVKPFYFIKCSFWGYSTF